MAGEKKPGRLHRLMRKAEKALRLLWGIYHQKTNSRGWDLDDLAHRMIRSLYRKTAAELGLETYDVGRIFCIAGRGKRYRIWGCTTEFDNHPLYGITEDKMLIKTLFREDGLPVPEGRAFDWRDRAAGVEYALSLGRPCVVKPASDTSCGKGVTTHLTERGDIAHAFRIAGLFAPRVLVEEYLTGDNYRFLVYKGKCLSVVRRELPAVIGDGASTLLELVKRENRNRIQSAEWHEGDPGWMPLPINTNVSRHLNRKGLDWSYVPKSGVKVHLGNEASFRNGCTYTEVLEKTHPEQIRAAEEAARFVGMTIAGVDIISLNIEAPDYHIVEINISPGMELHYMLRNPEEMKDPLRAILMDYFEIDEAGSARQGAVSEMGG